MFLSVSFFASSIILLNAVSAPHRLAIRGQAGYGSDLLSLSDYQLTDALYSIGNSDSLTGLCQLAVAVLQELLDQPINKKVPIENVPKNVRFALALLGGRSPEDRWIVDAADRGAGAMISVTATTQVQLVYGKSIYRGELLSENVKGMPLPVLRKPNDIVGDARNTPYLETGSPESSRYLTVEATKNINSPVQRLEHSLKAWNLSLLQGQKAVSALDETLKNLGFQYCEAMGDYLGKLADSNECRLEDLSEAAKNQLSQYLPQEADTGNVSCVRGRTILCINIFDPVTGMQRGFDLRLLMVSP